MKGTLTRIWTCLSTHSPLPCPLIRKGEQMRENKRRKCVEEKENSLKAFFRVQLDKAEQGTKLG